MLDNLNVMGYTGKQLILPLATAIGAYGGFPNPPRVFSELTQNELVRWALVWVLIYQGGSGQDSKLALLITALMYAIHKAIE